MSDVLIVAYQAHWPAQFLQIAGELHTVFSNVRAQVEHIGSTAVPGLCAKPVLDVLLGVDSLQCIAQRLPALAALGYVYRPAYEAALPERRYFVRPAGATERVHLHGVLKGGLIWQRHLQFRDRLRQDSEARTRYAELKRELAARHAADKSAYTEAKAPFIQALLASGRADR